MINSKSQQKYFKLRKWSARISKLEWLVITVLWKMFKLNLIKDFVFMLA